MEKLLLVKKLLENSKTYVFWLFSRVFLHFFNSLMTSLKNGCHFGIPTSYLLTNFHGNSSFQSKIRRGTMRPPRGIRKEILPQVKFPLCYSSPSICKYMAALKVVLCALVTRPNRNMAKVFTSVHV